MNPLPDRVIPDRFIPPGWPVESDWSEQLGAYFQEPDFQRLCEFVGRQRADQRVYPSVDNVFTAFRLNSFSATKVVILGQDPYHGPGQAHGLSFSVVGDVKIPPSLRNIYREFCDDLNVESPATGNLTAWARQGVFLLNTVLTVREGEANSHRNQGWERFTDHVIRQLNKRPDGIVFILWGKPAQKKKELIDVTRHCVISAPHPSPLSAHRGFFGSRPFTQANDALRSMNQRAVNWKSIDIDGRSIIE